MCSLALVGCGEYTPSAWDDIAAKVFCKDQIKSLLRDPDSTNSSAPALPPPPASTTTWALPNQEARSKNGFGGYRNGLATASAMSEAVSAGSEPVSWADAPA